MKKKMILMINVPQLHVNYVTTFSISQITNHVCLAHTEYLFDIQGLIWLWKIKTVSEKRLFISCLSSDN